MWRIDAFKLINSRKLQFLAFAQWFCSNTFQYTAIYCYSFKYVRICLLSDYCAWAQILNKWHVMPVLLLVIVISDICKYLLDILYSHVNQDELPRSPVSADIFVLQHTYIYDYGLYCRLSITANEWFGRNNW